MLLSPFIPHFTSECLSEFSMIGKQEQNWPKVETKYLKDDNINLVIQINGKKREILNMQRDLEESEILKIIDNNEKLKKYTKNKQILKKIFVKNKIINLIINENN